MSRETTFKEGAWISGFEFRDENQLHREIEDQESLLGKYKTQFAILYGMANRDGKPDESDGMLHEFEELWEGLQDVMFHLARLYVVDMNKEYIDNGED